MSQREPGAREEDGCGSLVVTVLICSAIGTLGMVLLWMGLMVILGPRGP